ncbi:class I tRNA ligase family protein [Bacillus pacificus]|nr:class I tRNA ligase family protein [Bacillus pacificus]
MLLDKCKLVFNFYKPRLFETLENLRTQFVLENQRSSIDLSHQEIVADTFVDLFEQEYITRTRIPINWCPLCETIISQVEAKPSYTRIHRYIIRLKTELNEDLLIYSEEPEMLKGYPFAVLPDETSVNRIMHPLKPGEYIPIVKASEVSKLQPGFLYWPESNLEAYQIAKRNNWPTVSTNLYSLEDRLNARDEVVEELILVDAYVQTEAENIRIHRCHCDTKLETLPLEQWVLNLVKIRQDLNIDFDISPVVPTFAQEEWLPKVENYIGDWTLSRQSEWGVHPPAYQCKSCGKWHVTTKKLSSCSHCQGELEQDHDVMDVWFISNVGKITWGQDERRNSEKEILSSISLGSDTFGLAMIRTELLSQLLTGRSLAERVVVLPILVDEWGRKLSKSLGNAKPTQDYLNQWGADILRLALLRARPWNGKVTFGEHLFIKSRNLLQKVKAIKDFILVSDDCTDKTMQPDATDLILLDSLGCEISDAEAILYDAVKNANFFIAIERIEEVTRKVFSNIMVPYLRWKREQGKLSYKTLRSFQALYLDWVKILWAFIPDAALTIYEEFEEELLRDSKRMYVSSEHPINLDFRVINQVLNKSRDERELQVVPSWKKNIHS